MAKRLNYQIGITGDVTQLKAALSEADRLLRQISSYDVGTNLTHDMHQAAQAAKELGAHLNNAVNKNTGKLDLSKLQASIHASGKSLQDYANRLQAIGPSGERAFLSVASAVAKAEMPIRRSNKLLNEMWITMKNTARWQLTSSALHSFVGTLQTAYGYSKDLNRSLNEIRIVSSKSTEEMAKFADQANKAAKRLSSTTTDYTDAALIYYQQGLSDQEIQERTETTIKMANVTRDSAEDVSSYMTAIWNNFADGSKELEYYSDVITRLGADTAASSAEIAEGLEKFAAVADTIGLSYEYAAASLATVVAETRQAPEIVGNAFKTIFARIQGLSLGETLEDGVGLNKYSEALNTVGVQVLESNGAMREADAILSDLGKRWDDLSNSQQTALAQTVAGVRQYSQFISIMDNWDKIMANVNKAETSEGSLQEQADIYAESWEAARDRVRASAEDVYDSLLNDKFFIEVTDGFSTFLDGVSGVTDGLGGMKGVLLLVGQLVTTVFGDKLAQGLRNITYNLGSMIGVTDELERRVKKNWAETALRVTTDSANTSSLRIQETEMQREEVQIQLKLNEYAKNLTEEEYKQLELQKEIVSTINQAAMARANESAELEKQADTLAAKIIENSGTDEKSMFRETAKDPNAVGIGGTTYTSSVLKQAEQDMSNLYQGNLTNLEEISAAYQSLKKAEGVLKTLQNQWNNLQSETDENVKSSEQYKAQIKQIERAFKELTGVELLSDGMLDSAVKEIENSATRAGNVIKEQFSNGSLQAKNYIQGMGKDMQEAGATMQQGANIAAAGRGATQDLINQVQISSKQVKDLGDQIVRTANVLGSLAMAAQAFKNVGSIISNEDLTFGEKAIQLMSASSMIIMSLVPMMGLLNKAEKEKIATTIADSVATNINAAGHMTFAGAVNVATAAVVTFSKALWANPFTKIILGIGGAVLAVSGLIKVLDAFGVTARGAQQKIDESTDAYENQKNKVQELNQTLEETQSRIKELEEQGTLTIVEEEELNKLREQEARTKQLLEYHKELEKRQLAASARAIASNFQTSTNNLKDGPNLGSHGGQTIDRWRANEEAKLAKLKPLISEEEYVARLNELETEYTKWADDNMRKVSEWATENSEAIQKVEDEYALYVEAINSGVYDYNEAEATRMANTIAEVRKQSFATEAEYQEVYFKPILDRDSLNGIENQLYNALAKGDVTEEIENMISEPLKKDLLAAGISVDEFLKYLNDRIDSTRNELNEKGLISGNESFFNNLSADDWNIIAELNLEKIDDFKELTDEIEKYKYNKIVVETSVEGSLDSVKAWLDPMQKAIDAYNDNGMLSAEEVQELIAANGAYAAYITKVGDSYVLTQQAVDDYNTKLKEQQFYVDELIKENQDLGISLTFLDTYKTTLTQIAEQSESENFAGFVEEFNSQLTAYQEGKISIDDYITSIDNLTAKLSEVDTKTAQAAIVELTSLLQDSIAQNINALNSNQITLVEYMKNTRKATESSIKLFDQANEAVKKGNAGYYVNRLSKAWREMDKEQKEALENTVEGINKTVKELEKMEGIEVFGEVITDNFSVFEQFEDEFGDLDFTITPEIDSSKLDSAYATIEQKTIEGFARLKSISETEYQSHLNTLKTLADQHNVKVTADAETGMIIMQGLAQNKMDVLDDFYNSIQQSAQETNSNMATAISDIFTGLGELIDNFDYEFNFDLSGFQSVFGGMVGNGLFTMPEKLKITGSSSGAGISGALDKIKSGAMSIANQLSSNMQDRFGADTSDWKPFSNNAADVLGNTSAGNRTGKGGGGGGAKDPEELDAEEVADRYHEITRAIEQQAEVLEDLDDQIDRTYGTAKLELYRQKMEEINRQATLYQKKMTAAGDFLKIDKAELLKLLPDTVIDPTTNEILNYTATEAQVYAKYNEWIDSYNKLSASQQEAKKKEKEDMEQWFNDRIDALEQYEETLDAFREASNEWEDQMREKEDIKLAEVEAKLDIVLRREDIKEAARDFSKTIAESFGDVLTHGDLVRDIEKTGVQSIIDLTDDYQQQADDLFALLDNRNAFTDTEAIVESLEDLQGEIISSGESLLEWAESVESMLPDAIDAARERFELFTNQLEHNTSVLDTMKELMALQGITYKTEKGYEGLRKASQERIDASLTEAKLNRQWFERATVSLSEAEKALVGVAETDAIYDTLKNNRDALLAEYNESQQAMLEAARDSMEAAKDMFTLAIEEAAHAFEKAITGNQGLDYLELRYNNLIKSEEAYLDEVNTTYETLKWNSKLQNSIDTASSTAAASRLKQLQEEINLRTHNNKLSQYDLDILNAKYEMTLAQIALEEAQNNKSQVRLMRNSQGNWDYVYTADQDAVDDAEQKYADAANNYYNIAKDRVKETMDSILELKQNTAEQLQEVYLDEALTEEERKARITEIQRNANEEMLRIQREYHLAVGDMTAAGGDVIEEYGNTYSEIMDLMEEGTADFNTYMDEAIENMDSAWREYQDTVHEVAEATGTDYDSLSQQIDKVSEATDKCGTAGEQAADALWNSLDQIRETTEGYKGLMEQVYDTIRALEDLARMTRLADSYAVPAKPLYSDDYAAAMGGVKYGSSEYYGYLEGRKNKTEGMDFSSGRLDSNERVDALMQAADSAGKSYTQFMKDNGVNAADLTKLTAEDWKKLIGFSTGGYTGDFNGGKLALLHEKELVLNSKDTHNMLTAVSMVRSLGPAIFRQIEAILDNNAIAGANLMNSKLSSSFGFNVGTNDLVQHLDITAEFPNATDQNEIREAILGLANYATQFINKR